MVTAYVSTDTFKLFILITPLGLLLGQYINGVYMKIANKQLLPSVYSRFHINIFTNSFTHCRALKVH